MTAAERARAALNRLKSKPLGGSRDYDAAVESIATEIETAECNAWNAALEQAEQALEKEQIESPISRHDTQVNQILERAIEIVRALKKT